MIRNIYSALERRPMVSFIYCTDIFCNDIDSVFLLPQNYDWPY